MNELPDAGAILQDVQHRGRLLLRLREGDDSLDADEWESLVFYARNHDEARSEFMAAMREIARGGDARAIAADLPPHARWLVAVYSGLRLDADWCRGGSRFHARVIDQLGGVLQASRILAQVPGVAEGVSNLSEALAPLERTVIRNLAVDETLEQLGRRMSS